MADAADGPKRQLAPEVAVADLTVAEVEGESGRRDLIARFLCRSEDGDDEGPLIDWASRTGYSMLWLPDRLVDAGDRPQPPRGRRARAARPAAPTWSRDDPRFWAEVLGRGYFPDTCDYCGCSLPEWSS